MTATGAALGGAERDRRRAEAAARAVALAGSGVDAVALTFVDNAGIVRVKTVPLSGLEHAAAWGVGMSPVFDAFLLDDSIAPSGGPDGDLRLLPDVRRLTPLAAQPGWAWAPVDRYAQEGLPHPGCQRLFARRMADRALDAGCLVRAGIEVEWAVGTERDGAFVPACAGPGYGMTRLVELSDYCREVHTALAAEGLPVLQVHPEYAAGQFEVSVAPADPVAAADAAVLTRETIRAVSTRHGLRASFAPMVAAGTVGNGGHIHLSVHRDGAPLLAGGEGPYGLTAAAESFLAGLLAELPALLAIGAPSVSSYLRQVPSHWAGVYRCWGRENREAALRLVTGSPDQPDAPANVEVKCVDLSANPYLLVGALLAAGLSTLDKGLRLPPEVTGDPATWSAGAGGAQGLEADQGVVPRLPRSLPEALAELERSEVLREALGAPLYDSFLDVRRAEVALFAGASPEDVVAATRWRY